MPVLNVFAAAGAPRPELVEAPDVSLGASAAALQARELVERLDWTRTSLGARASWPATLSVMVETVLAARPPMAVVWGKDFNLIYNGGYLRILGERHPAAMGLPLAQVWPETWDHVRPLFEEAMSGTPVRVREARYRLTRDGEPLDAWFDFSLTPLRSSIEQVGGVLVNLTETTYRKKLELTLRGSEAHLREMDKRKDAFLATLAHELRNPLAPIATGATILAKVKDDPAKVAHFADLIGRQARHMTALVDDLLDVSRMARGLVEIRRDVVGLEMVAREAMEQAAPLVEAKQQRLHAVLPQAEVEVQGDHKRLVQVLVNLLQNAAKFTPRGGVLTLEVRAQGADAIVCVSDTGEGMTAEFLRQAFDLFAQAHPPGASSHSGLGIGLALVKTLVQMHGGSVRARSAGPGRGSEFEIRLPRIA